MGVAYPVSYGPPAQWSVVERAATRLSSSDRWWLRVVLVVTLGYLTLGRSFAYFGIVPLKLFVGEIVLAAFVITRFREVVGRWLGALARPGALSSFSIAFLLFFLYGFWLALRGYTSGYPVVRALQNLVFNYYPLYVFLGLWAARVDPDVLRRFIPMGALVHGVYAIAAMLGLENLPIKLARDVPLFGEPLGAGVFLLGLLCFPPRSRLAFWGLLLLNTVALLGVQVRAQWLSFGVALLVWALAARRLGALYGAAVTMALVLTIGAFVNLELPGLRERGGNVTVKSMVARIIAPIHEELAVELGGEGMRTAKGTYEWRVKWWRSIWRNIHWDEPWLQAFGFGYGYPLFKLHPQLSEEEHEIRSPHNVFFYCLGYGGWVGVVVFYLFQLVLARLQYRAALASGTLFGLLLWLYMFIQAHFGNIFESPFASIPTYILLGMSCGPLVRREEGRAQ